HIRRRPRTRWPTGGLPPAPARSGPSEAGRFGGIIAASDREPLGDVIPEGNPTMTRLRSPVLPLALTVAITLMAGSTAQGQERPPHPFASTWANLAGSRVFTEKGCGLCHAIRGAGPTA